MSWTVTALTMGSEVEAFIFLLVAHAHAYRPLQQL
jgi:hypothetical protein